MQENAGPVLIPRRSVLAGVVLVLLSARTLGADPGTPASPLGEAVYSTHLHDVGLLSVPVVNSGQFGGAKYGAPNWQGGNYLGVCGLWVGAYVSGGDGQPHVSTVESTEFRPDLDPRWTIYESYEGIHSGTRLTDRDATAGDDDGDGLFNEDFQNGLDDDGDGKIDEDYDAAGQQMFSCMYRDDTPGAIAELPDHQPLHVLVRQRSFQWATEGNSDWVGMDFTVVNTGSQSLLQVYLGFYADFDAGLSTDMNYWEDDLAGWSHVDTTVVDPFGTGSCADRELSMDAVWVRDGAGSVSGVVGALVLGHPLDDAGINAPQTLGPSSIHWVTTSGGLPADDAERYQLMDDGTKPAANAALPGDYRCLIAVGPFYRLDPGESVDFQMAVVAGDGIPGFRRNLAAAKMTYEGRYIDADDDPQSGIDGKERCLRTLDPLSPVLWDDPCDTLQVVDPPWTSPDCKWVDSDCDSCTGQDGRETRLNWVGEVLPVSVELLSFTAERSGPSAVIRWVVGAAEDHAGFHLYRQEPGGERVRITPSLLANRSEYEFVDPKAPTGPAAYWLLEVSRAGAGTWYGPVSLGPAVGQSSPLRAGPVVPNPFRSRMSLSYRLPESRSVRASVYDLSGRLIRVLAAAVETAGDHTVTWNGETRAGTRAKAGLYILRIEAGRDVLTRKVVLVE
jgi:hypothetical protein